VRRREAIRSDGSAKTLGNQARPGLAGAQPLGSMQNLSLTWLSCGLNLMAAVSLLEVPGITLNTSLEQGVDNMDVGRWRDVHRHESSRATLVRAAENLERLPESSEAYFSLCAAHESVCRVSGMFVNRSKPELIVFILGGGHDILVAEAEEEKRRVVDPVVLLTQGLSPHSLGSASMPIGRIERQSQLDQGRTRHFPRNSSVVFAALL